MSDEWTLTSRLREESHKLNLTLSEVWKALYQRDIRFSKGIRCRWSWDCEGDSSILFLQCSDL